ncbi:MULTISPECIES: ExbD/TolR family protein [Marinobacter]|jgi:biopolymer transport protein ExbD|uniref:Biopolymer transporter ExbD n=1 Tax=Marinobacter vinifirmus TaxID=355591 RepID=A0A7Z1INK1_9GAMM|nr:MULTISPECIES: biopolymer transporter ExbD [Marinobacter]MCE0759995.1 biopolymer transporter ExbD [Marinobacter sp. G11]OZC36882.1 biopolymer transporter ExbD [Marinobacter vinifirmus]HBM50822.1 biopolymer transporter ExbD [Marinobacter sp.]|tara:strand:+ start:1855 stop:2265 length:411 start_codon:yes stop_codon:yes gene_type:complete
MTELVPPPSTSGKGLLDRVEDALLPLINLVFLLLIFFIVAGQLTNEPLPELPGAARQQQERAPEADLMVAADGQWKVQGKVLGEEQLLAALPQPDDNNPLRIAADQSLTMSDLEALLSVLEQGGYTEVLLLTEPGQ